MHDLTMSNPSSHPARPAGASTARAEWAAMWPLPLVAMLGHAGAATFAYSSGVFMEPMTRELGWSRAEFSLAFMLQMIVGLIIQPLVGRLIDKVGPRAVGLRGIIPAALAIGLLGLVGKPVWQWWGLCVAQSMITCFILPAVWITPVVGRFKASRGLALAVVLAGVGVASALWPVTAAFYIPLWGWRLSFLAMGITWGIIIFPLAYFFLKGPRDLADQGRSGVTTRKVAPFGEALKSRTFLCLTLAGGMFAVISLGMSVHLVPLLKASGMSTAAAASVTGLAGLFSVTGRIGTGFLLDRVPTKPLGICVFLLPILMSLLLWNADGSVPVSIFAAMLLGLAGGAETDLVYYIAAREFQHGAFASVSATTGAFFGICASFGPLIAGRLFDATGSYHAWLLAICPLAIGGALLIATLPAGAGKNEQAVTAT